MPLYCAKIILRYVSRECKKLVVAQSFGIPGEVTLL